MSLLPFFQWCENSAVGEAIRGSSWLFPVIESFHLLGLAVIGGAILVVDLRLCGLGLRRQPVAQSGPGRAAMADRESCDYAFFGRAAVYVRSPEVLRPRGFLGEDEIPVPWRFCLRSRCAARSPWPMRRAWDRCGARWLPWSRLCCGPV